MRTRLVIPAALLVAAAYMKGRRDESERPLSPPACELSDAIRLRAEAEAADAMEILGERPPPSPASVPADPAVVRALVPVEPVAPAEPVAPLDVVARAEAEVAAVASPPAPRARDVFDPWVVPEFPRAARARRPRPAAPVVGAPPPAPPVVAAPPAREPAAVPAGPDLATLAEWSALPSASVVTATPAAPAAPAAATVADASVETLSEWATHVVAGAFSVPEDAPPAIEVVIDESGRFSLGGWAAQAGHMALCGVTFRDRRDAPLDAAAIRLVPDAVVNVAEGGLVVLGDAGFAPDGEGFTLLVAAAGAGAFAATGRYEVLGA